MKEPDHLTKIKDLKDPMICKLLDEFSLASNYYPEGLPELSLFTYFSLWETVGGAAINSKNFPIDGIWSMRISELPKDQLLIILESFARLKGGSLEKYGDVSILKLMKNFRLTSKLTKKRKNQKTREPSVEQRLVLQRRYNGTL
jgi:hypothetical protein